MFVCITFTVMEGIVVFCPMLTPKPPSTTFPKVGLPNTKQTQTVQQHSASLEEVGHAVYHTMPRALQQAALRCDNVSLFVTELLVSEKP